MNELATEPVSRMQQLRATPELGATPAAKCSSQEHRASCRSKQELTVQVIGVPGGHRALTQCGTPTLAFPTSVFESLP